MKILILLSHTGGGHVAAARAVQEALHRIRPDVEVELRDGLVEGSPWPMNRSPALYSWAMRRGRMIYAFLWHLSNGPRRSRLMADLGGTRRLRGLLDEVDADLVVSVHPLLTRSVLQALRANGSRAPLAVVVTDLLTAHWSWFEPEVPLTLVPLEEVRRRAVAEGGMDPGRVRVTGQVVHPESGEAVARREELRRSLGWDRPVVLLLAAGDGGGLIERHLHAAVDARLEAHLVMVCGRDRDLHTKLTGSSWASTVEVHGFVNNLHELMAAADILVTKAGPGSIMEGCVAGLPMLLYDRLPGQEVGNVQLVRERGMGSFVQRPGDLMAALRAWLDDPAARARAAEASKAAGVPDSATRIAREVLALLEGGAP